MKDGKYNQENLTNELNKLVAENAENQQQIKDLEDKIRLLTDRETAACNELERQEFQGFFLEYTFFYFHGLARGSTYTQRWLICDLKKA